jgi:hypothetical protein
LRGREGRCWRDRTGRLVIEWVPIGLENKYPGDNNSAEPMETGTVDEKPARSSTEPGLRTMPKVDEFMLAVGLLRFTKSNALVISLRNCVVVLP